MRPKLDYRKHILSPTATIADAMRVMSRPEVGGMILVVDRSRKLLGVIVDSDLRKAMLKGMALSAPLLRAMNRKPLTLAAGLNPGEIARAVGSLKRAYIPLVDGKGRVAGLLRKDEGGGDSAVKPNWVIVLAGGLGTRLAPLTADRPKPLLPIGDKPLLETIVEQFVESGFRRFIFLVRHRAEQIQNHFGDGFGFGAEIHYVVERERLGTAGALSLIRRRFTAPAIVMNGDLLTKVDFQSLLDFHVENKGLATVCVREHSFQVPYGVVEMDRYHMRRIDEKPTHSFFINAGIYVLEPEAIKSVPSGREFHMTMLLERLRRKRGRAVSCFPIREYWLDIGRLADYERAQADFGKHF